MKIHELIIAVLLSLVTLLAVYAIWYVARGRYLKEKRARERAAKQPDGHHHEEERPRDGKGMRWGVRKDSYSYPSINDVMGYEFVHVVDIPDSIRPKSIAGAADETQAGETPAVQQQTTAEKEGFRTENPVTVTTGSTTGQKDIEEDTSFPMEKEEPHGGRPYYRPRQESVPAQNEHAPKKAGEQSQPEENPADGEGDISARDLEELEMLSPWNSNDREYDVMAEEELLDAIDNQPEMVDRSFDMEEAERIAREQQELETFRAAESAYAEAAEDQENDNFGMNLLDRMNQRAKEIEAGLKGEEGSDNDNDNPDIVEIGKDDLPKTD